MIILGIDPGVQRAGYGIIEVARGRLRYVAAGTLRVSSHDHHVALLEIKNEMDALVARFRPDRAAIERLYFAKNQKTAFSVAEARGVILLSLLEHGLPVAEYAPNEIKLQVAGYGFADKKGVEKMVRRTLSVPAGRLVDDAIDALAAALSEGARARLDTRL